MIDGKVVGKITRGEKGPWKSQLPVKVNKGVKHTLALHTYGSPEPERVPGGHGFFRWRSSCNSHFATEF
jgi:hypothetical protein